MLGTPSEEVKHIERAKSSTQQLRDRWEDDFGLFRNEKFTMPKSEGKWDSWTSNRPTTTAYRIVHTLSSSRLKLFIPLSDEDEKKRRNLSKTEAFPYGVIALRDSIYGNVPGALSLHDALSWFATIRGWVAVLCYLSDDENGTKPHLPVWDPLNTFWSSGSDGLLWVAHRRWANPDEVKETYGSSVTTETDKEIEVLDLWDREEQGIIVNKEYVIKDKHGLEHVPVFIAPSGATPLIQSSKYKDTIKNVGESWAVNNRNIYEAENRMGSMSMTMAGRTAKTPMAHEYEGPIPPEMNLSPFEKGSEIFIDVSRKEKIYPLTPPQATKDFYAFSSEVKNSLDVGDMAPVSFSQLFQPQTAAGMNLLRKLSELNIMAPKNLIERTYVWLAHELVSQYKGGPFKSLEIQGIDGSNRRFRMEVKPKDIDDQWNFEAQLLADFPADEMANMGMAVQAHEAGLLSIETIMDRLLHVQNVDAEQLKIDREKVFQVAGIKLRKLAADLMDPERGNDPEAARFILDEIEGMKAESRPGIAPQTGIPSPVRPSADTSAVVPQPPQAGKLRKFLSRLGGGV